MVDISVVIATYNHQDYIEEAINSVLMQKGNFTYEVLIGEDCSVDNTRKVLKKIEKKLPKNFKIYYREKNMGGYGENNFLDLYMRMTGRYYIVLEGDDFWVDEYKLEKQFNFLENNREYIAVAHNTIVVNKNGELINENYPECKKDEYLIEDYAQGILPGQTTTILMRNYITFPMFDYRLISSNQPGDRKKAFLLVANGRIKCMQEKMSAYRHVTDSGSSFSARTKRCSVDYNDVLTFYYSLNEYAVRCKLNLNVIKITEKMLFEYMIKCAIMRRANVNLFHLIIHFTKSEYKSELYKVTIFFIGKILKRLCYRLLGEK
ncbi:MAG: glycosyltransferase [Butyrivibrio sp.]|nr:glycosyltransferase [Butyrivibrio sp.]